MSQAQPPQSSPDKYTSGDNRYINFALDFLVDQLSEKQKEVLRTIATNQRTLIWGGNGPGKSFITILLKLGFLYTNPDSIVLGTSGSYQQYEDTMWKPLDDIVSEAQEKHGLPGQMKRGNQKMLKLDKEWYAKIVSPRDPGELEGRHGSDVLVVIDEADKKYVTEEHFDSGGSSITDLNDKIVAICNPPDDQTNVVYEKKENDPRWEVVELSAFDSHNAQVDAGKVSGPRIPGMTDLITIASDWESWNKRPWPLAEESYPGDWPGMPQIENQIENGVIDRDDALDWIAPGYSVAEEAHKRWDSLDRRWYKRRAGVIPPTGAGTHRPFEPQDVRSAWQRNLPAGMTETPRAVAIDVARKNDKTIMLGEHNMVLRVHYAKQGDNHETQKREVVDGTASTPGLSEWPDPEVAVDKGYAPGFHDYVADRVPNVFGFQNGTKPTELTRWYDKWAEGLYHLGQWLEAGGVIESAELREELMVASRVVEFSARTLNSRGHDGAEVYEATAKEDIKEELGHSPDYLDAAIMTVWRLRTNPMPGSVDSTWYDPYETA